MRIDFGLRTNWILRWNSAQIPSDHPMVSMMREEESKYTAVGIGTSRNTGTYFTTNQSGAGKIYCEISTRSTIKADAMRCRHGWRRNQIPSLHGPSDPQRTVRNMALLFSTSASIPFRLYVAMAKDEQYVSNMPACSRSQSHANPISISTSHLFEIYLVNDEVISIKHLFCN